MSTIAVKKVKLGDNADLSKNFLIEVPAVADGTLMIKREDGTNVLSIDNDGTINLNYVSKSFTPVMSGTTVAGVGTYTVQIGRYIDMGSLVWFQARLEWTAHTGTGSMRFNLPLPVNLQTIVPLATYANGLNAGGTPLAMIVSASVGQEVQLYGVSDTGGSVALPSVDTSGAIAFSGVYFKQT